MPACAVPISQAYKHNQTAFPLHQERRLKEASEAYDKALRLVPPVDPTPAQQALIRRHAPQLYTVPSDPFPLKDFAAILHPTKPWIAYHLFWEDDIDFPDDNDPCDHEVIWVQLDPTRSKVVAVYTYFHGRILSGPAATRPIVWIQWGKHGSMPANWPQLEAANKKDFVRLTSIGRASAESPLGKSWPLKFTGDWRAFTNFTQLIDPVQHLEKTRHEKVSPFSNAVINRHFLRYNFAAKIEWPDAICQDR